jgi:hypothetical protein
VPKILTGIPRDHLYSAKSEILCNTTPICPSYFGQVGALFGVLLHWSRQGPGRAHKAPKKQRETALKEQNPVERADGASHPGPGSIRSAHRAALGVSAHAGDDPSRGLRYASLMENLRRARSVPRLRRSYGRAPSGAFGVAGGSTALPARAERGLLAAFISVWPSASDGSQPSSACRKWSFRKRSL